LDERLPMLRLPMQQRQPWMLSAPLVSPFLLLPAVLLAFWAQVLLTLLDGVVWGLGVGGWGFEF